MDMNSKQQNNMNNDYNNIKEKMKIEGVNLLPIKLGLELSKQKKVTKIKENKGKKEVKVKKEKKVKKEVETKEETCSVCCELYSNTTRKKIECPKCEYKCCKKCIEFYLLSSIKNTPNCMNCNLEFSSAFVFEKTSKIFGRDRYIEKQAVQVLTEQKSLLPATLILYNRKKEIQKRREEIKIELLAIKDRTALLYAELDGLKIGKEMEIEERCHRPCPVNECKGYLSSAWKCGLCEMYVCHECGNAKGKRTDEDHVCNEDDKKTMIMLKKDTKSCPGCFKYIHKTEGCDQMFCVGCHTVFSWNSGKKLHGVVCHNPHYYEYQRNINGGEAPRVAGDVPYNQCADNEELQAWWVLKPRFYTLDDKALVKLSQIHRSIHHNDELVIRNVNNKLSETRKNRIYSLFREKYLESSHSGPFGLPLAPLKRSSDDYTEENWLSNIKSEIKMIEKFKQAKMIYDLLKIVVIDIFVKMSTNLAEVKDTFMQEFENIRKYSNLQLLEINKNYGTKVFIYNDRFILE